LFGFRLSDLHDCWQTLKEPGKIAAERTPRPEQKALKEPGLAEVDWLTRDMVLTESGLAGARNIKLS